MTNKTFKEIVEAWKESKRPYVKQSTFSTYMLILTNHVVPCFGDKRCLTEEEVQTFVLEKLNQGMSVKSIKDMLVILKMVMKFGVKQQWTSNCEWDIKYPAAPIQKKMEVLTVKNHRKILDHVQRYLTFRNLGIYICLTTGLRIGEVCALQWADVDTVNGVIVVRRTIERIYLAEGERRTKLIIGSPKTESSRREIPMTKELLALVKPFKRVLNPECYVLTNELFPTEPRTYRNYYRRLMKQLDIPYLKFHGLRHSFATRCIESNCDYKTVSVLLGHSNINTTLDLYVHPNMEQKKRCMAKMFKSLGR